MSVLQRHRSARLPAETWHQSCTFTKLCSRVYPALILDNILINILCVWGYLQTEVDVLKHWRRQRLSKVHSNVTDRFLKISINCFQAYYLSKEKSLWFPRPDSFKKSAVPAIETSLHKITSQPQNKEIILAGKITKNILPPILSYSYSFINLWRVGCGSEGGWQKCNRVEFEE